MIDPGHPRLSIVRHCELAAVSRATFYRTPAGESAERSPSCGLSMRRFWNAPSTARARWFAIFAALEGRSDAGASAGGCEAHPAHKTYPYLLRKLLIERPNHVWCADVTYIPMRRGFLYLVAVMDWATRKVLAWRLSNTMEADFCVAALNDAMDAHGRPEIFNTDQGGQFISHAFTGALADGPRWTVSDALADGLNRHRSLDRLLQPAASALGAGRQDARRGPCYRNPAGEFGGLKPAVPHLSKAANLSQRPAPV